MRFHGAVLVVAFVAAMAIPVQAATKSTAAKSVETANDVDASASSAPVASVENDAVDHSVNAPTPDARSWWNPSRMHHSIGVELADPAFGVLGSNAINYAYSLERFGVDAYFGYSKGSDTTTSEDASVANDTASPKTLTVVNSYGGEKNPKTIAIGVQPKYVVYGDKWFRFTAGLMLARISQSSVSYDTGTTTTTYANSADKTNYTVTETGRGTTSKSTTAKIVYGPRLNTDIYLKWFPHIALGFGTGILMSSGGNTTVDESTTTTTYAVLNGARQAATVESKSSQSKTTSTGGSASTFAVGGTKFSLMGNFGIRYIW